jgi:hypothetical protein
MRLSVLAALGITAFLGIMTIGAPDANAIARSTTVVSGPRGTAAVSRSRGMRGAAIVRRGRGAAVVSGARGAAVVSGARGAAIVRGPRGATVACRWVMVNGVRVRRCI